MPRIKKPYFARAHLSSAINPKLTPDQVREIRKIYAMVYRSMKKTGKTRGRPGIRQDLAKKFGVSVTAIDKIRNGTRWKTLR